MLAKVAYPALNAPYPEIIGILATALPVPHYLAKCSAPALWNTACPYILIFAILECTKLKKSFLIGAVKTPGNAMCSKIS